MTGTVNKQPASSKRNKNDEQLFKFAETPAEKEERRRIQAIKRIDAERRVLLQSLQTRRRVDGGNAQHEPAVVVEAEEAWDEPEQAGVPVGWILSLLNTQHLRDILLVAVSLWIGSL